MNHNPCPISSEDDRGPRCIETAQASPKDLQEHVEPPLLVEEGEYKSTQSPMPPNPASHEEDVQQEEGDFLPLCFASFYFLKQMSNFFNQAQKMWVKDEAMSLFRMNDGGSEQMKPIVHPSFPFCQHVDEWLRPT